MAEKTERIPRLQDLERECQKHSEVLSLSINKKRNSKGGWVISDIFIHFNRNKNNCVLCSEPNAVTKALEALRG